MDPYTKKEDHQREGIANARDFFSNLNNKSEENESDYGAMFGDQSVMLRWYDSVKDKRNLTQFESSLMRVLRSAGVIKVETIKDVGFDYREDSLREATYAVTNAKVRILHYLPGYLVTFIDSDGLVKRDGPEKFVWSGHKDQAPLAEIEGRDLVKIKYDSSEVLPLETPYIALARSSYSASLTLIILYLSREGLQTFYIDEEGVLWEEDKGDNDLIIPLSEINVWPVKDGEKLSEDIISRLPYEITTNLVTPITPIHINQSR